MGKINAKGEGVRVEGLNELRLALRAVSAQAPRELAQAGKDVASFVAEDARGIASGLGGVAAKVAPSVSPSGTQRGGAVAFGGSAYPMAAGAEFGGRGRPTTQQFMPWRGSGAGAGYFVYPAIRQDAQRIETTYVELIDDLMKRYDLR